MSALIAIAARELHQRWVLLPAALLIGCVPVAMPALGFKGPLGDAESVGLILSLLFGTMTALICGWSVIGGELASRRLAFFFSRPTPWWAIWGGKLLASLLLTAAGGLLAALPLLAAGRGGHLVLSSFTTGRDIVVPFGLILLAVISLAHVGSVAYSSRSYWLAVDMALFLAWLGAIWAWSFPALVGSMAILGEPFLYGPPRLILVVLALLVAGAVGVWAGRTDARRVHAVQSLTLWALLFVGVSASAGLGWAIIQARPTDLRSVRVAAASPRGDWTWLAGEVRHSSYSAAFLYRPEDGRFLRLGGWSTGTPVFSADGRQAAWLSVPGGWRWVSWSAAQLNVADLAAREPTSRVIPLAVPPLPQDQPSIAFCPDATCLLVAQEGALTLYALPSGRRLWTANAAGGAWLAPVVFLGDDRLRAYRQQGMVRPGIPHSPSAALEIVTVHLADGSREVTGRIDTAPRLPSPRPSSSGERLLVFSEEARRSVVSLHDGASGARIAVLTGQAWKADAEFLSDGRIALVETGDKSATLRVLRADGSEERRLDLGAARSARLGGEPEPGWLSVGLAGPPFTPGDVAVVDLTTGSVRREKGLSVAESFWLMNLPRPSTGLGASFFIEADGALVRLDAKAGTRKVLLGGP